MTHPIRNQTRRRLRDAARAGFAVSAVMLAATVSMSIESPRRVDAVAIDGGAVTVVVPPGTPTAGNPLTAGGSATEFALRPPEGAACSGDSVAGYRAQSYMVPESVLPGSLTFANTGPLPPGSGAAFTQPLYSSLGSTWVNKTTAVTTGLLIGLPVLSFAWAADVGGITYLPAGTYNVGFACTKGVASATQLDKYWNTKLTIVAAAGDSPSGLTWTVPTGQSGTTTTLAATTTTTVAAATTTTTARATTTTTGAGTSTTTTSSGVTTTLFTNTTLFGTGSGSGSGSGGFNGSIVNTGSSPLPIIIWAVLLLVFGRMALLFGRPLRVLPPKSR